ncbi:hypothetical protein LXL04_034403 [Taraxacum kok-saghyz]
MVNENEVIYSLSGWLKNNPSAYHIKLVTTSKLPGQILYYHGLDFSHFTIVISAMHKPKKNLVTVFQFKYTVFKHVLWGFKKKKAEQSNPKPEKFKDVLSASHRAQVLKQKEVKPVPHKEKLPQIPNKKKPQNDKTSSMNLGSLATMWGRASSKPKPDPIPISNGVLLFLADAHVIADEMMENVSSDDEDEQMNFKRGSNGEGNNRIRRVVFYNSDDDDDDDDEEKDMVVSLSSQDRPKKQVSVDLKKSGKIDSKEKVKVSDVDSKSMSKEESLEKPISNENQCPKKDNLLFMPKYKMTITFLWMQYNDMCVDLL